VNIVLIDLSRRFPLLKVPSWMPVYLPSVAAVLRDHGHVVTLIERGVVDQKMSLLQY
jgi:hypothetical protein